MRQNARSDEFSIKKYIKPVLWGCIAGIAVNCAVLVLFSIVMSSYDISAMVYSPVSIAALCLAGFISGNVSARMLKERGMFFGALSGIVSFLIFLIISLIFPSTELGVLFVTKLIIMALAGAIGGIAGVNSRRKSKANKR